MISMNLKSTEELYAYNPAKKLMAKRQNLRESSIS